MMEQSGSRYSIKNIILVIGIICHSSFIIQAADAQLKDLTINADKVSIEKEKYRIEAEGSVEATYQAILLRGNHLIYNTSAETFRADRGFTLNYQGITIEGDTLDYGIKEHAGVATRVNFDYLGMRLGGGQIEFDREKYDLKNASFTACDLPGPHYRVTAADITLYPKYGWMVAYWGLFWLGNLPVVPMPTYIYDFQAEEKARRNLPPFPVIGSNVEDGNYIIETLAWNLRREFSGSYNLSYFVNKGVGLGATANYLLGDRNNGNLRLNWNGKDNVVGGLSHTLSFGGEVISSEKPLFDFFALPRYQRHELETNLTSRERINYQRVSFTPEFKLRSRAPGLYEMELTSGLVAEEGNTKLVRGGGKIKFYYKILGQVTPSLVLDALYYSNGTKWVKPSLGLDLSKDITDDVFLDAGYQHYLFVEGLSPFNYERYRFRAADRLLSGIKFKIGETAAKISASYFLDDRSPEDIDYTLFFKLHCYNLEATYRSIRQEFLLGFSLASK